MDEKKVIEGLGILEVLKPGKTKSGKDKYTVKIDDMWANWWQLDAAQGCLEAGMIGKEVKFFAEQQGTFVNIKSIFTESATQTPPEEQVGQTNLANAEPPQPTPSPPEVKNPNFSQFPTSKPDTATAIKRQVFLKCSVEMLKVNGEGMGIRKALDVVAYAKTLEQECNKEGWL